jgi:hypothetical protein
MVLTGGCGPCGGALLVTSTLNSVLTMDSGEQPISSLPPMAKGKNSRTPSPTSLNTSESGWWSKLVVYVFFLGLGLNYSRFRFAQIPNCRHSGSESAKFQWNQPLPLLYVRCICLLYDKVLARLFRSFLNPPCRRSMPNCATARTLPGRLLGRTADIYPRP